MSFVSSSGRHLVTQQVARARHVIAELRRMRHDEWELTAAALELWHGVAASSADDELLHFAFSEFDLLLQDERI